MRAHDAVRVPFKSMTLAAWKPWIHGRSVLHGLAPHDRDPCCTEEFPIRPQPSITLVFFRGSHAKRYSVISTQDLATYLSEDVE